METLIHPPLVSSMFPDPYSNYSWLIPTDESNKGSGSSSVWTKEENKMFESALAIYDEKTPQRWEKVAAMLPGKSVWDVIRQYKTLEEDVCDIEAGLIPLPGYITTPAGTAAAASSFTLEWVGNEKQLDSLRKKAVVASSTMEVASRPLEHERRKGVPWTEDEHRRFLLGLQKHGKGDWRNISRNFVISKTPTQVASHAQKYFLRQVSGGKDKRRPSIHDITTTNLLGGNFLPLDVKKSYNHYQNQQQLSTDDDQSVVLSSQHQKHNIVVPSIVLEWGQNNDELEQHTMVLNGIIAGT